MCQGGSPAKFENVATRSIVPDEVKRCGKLIEVKKPRIISLVLDVLICISLLVVQVFPLPTDRDSVRYCGTECAYRSAEIETRSGLCYLRQGGGYVFTGVSLFVCLLAGLRRDC